MPTFSIYDPGTQSSALLVNALLAPNSGLLISYNTVAVMEAGGLAFDAAFPRDTRSISFYDGGIAGLGIGAGLLLTSGDAAPPTSNTEEGYSVYLVPNNTDPQLLGAVTTAFPLAGEINDATTIVFSFQVPDVEINGIELDLMFGSDEYPEFADSDFVDIGAVFVNGVNYAVFDGSSSKPLSVISQTLSAGGFRDNESGTYPIEYDGISGLLTLRAPVQPGLNTIKIAIGDTGDQILDSGLFVANLRAAFIESAGLFPGVVAPPVDDFVVGTPGDDLITLGAGDDTAEGIGGDDTILGGPGIDTAIFAGDFADHQWAFIASRDGERVLLVGDGVSSAELTDIESLSFDDGDVDVEDLLLGRDTAHTALNLNTGQTVFASTVAERLAFARDADFEPLSATFPLPFEGPDTAPVYRVYSNVYDAYLWTSSEVFRDAVLAEPFIGIESQGTAFHAYDDPFTGEVPINLLFDWAPGTAYPGTISPLNLLYTEASTAPLITRLGLAIADQGTQYWTGELHEGAWAGAASTIPGSFGDDLLVGGSGNETFFPGAGEDTIDAGDGIDTVAFDGPSSLYDWGYVKTSEGDEYVLVEDVFAGTFSELSEVESLSFSDGEFDVEDLANGYDTAYAFLNHNTGQTVYATTAAERLAFAQDIDFDPLAATYRLPLEGIGTAPVFRVYSSVYDLYLWTASEALRDGILALPGIGIENQGVAFHAYTSAEAGGTVPIHMLYDWNPTSAFPGSVAPLNILYSDDLRVPEITRVGSTIEDQGVQFWL